MAELWNAFIQDYQNELFDWSTRELLEIFWHYCQDGDKAVYKLLNSPKKLKVDKEIERLKVENGIMAKDAGCDKIEIKKLRKENEWLIGRVSLYSDINKEDVRKLLVEYIQQALKEK